MFRCMYALALSLIPSISSNKPLFIKGIVVERRREVLKERMKKHGEGRGQAYLYAHSVKKVPDFLHNK